MYERIWQGIDLTSLPSAIDLRPGQIAGPAIYEEFYEALSVSIHKNDDAAWLAGKLKNGRDILETIITPWEQEMERRPKILSWGAGRGITEEVWLENGYYVTLQEVQAFSLTDIKEKYVNANILIGDARKTLIPDTYDIIFMLGLDYLMTDNELLDFLRHSNAYLNENGLLVNHCMNSLSVRKIFAHLLKVLLGTYKRRNHIFWGYYRSPVVIKRIAQRAGLRIKNQFFHQHVYNNGISNRILRRRTPLFLSLPTLDSASVITVFARDN